MRNMRTTILLVLLILAQCATTTACSQETTKETDGTTTAVQETETATDTELKPNLPENVDFGGETFSLLTFGFWDYEPLGISDIYAEEITGEAINDATFARISHMIEKFNCDVADTYTGMSQDGLALLTKSVQSQSDEFDIAHIRSENYPSAIANNLLGDLKDLPHTDFDMPWWDKTSMDQLGIAGKHFVITGACTVTDELSKWCIYFNKDMLLDYGLEDPYTLVRDGKWTYDTMMTMGAAVAADVDGNGVWDYNDRYGATYVSDGMRGLLNAFGYKLAELDENNIPYLTINNENAINAMMQLIEGFTDESVTFNMHKRPIIPGMDETGAFRTGKCLFSIGGIYYCRNMREMEQDFGIVPYPKQNEEQERHYYSVSPYALPFTSIPITNTDYENTSIFLEEFAYIGHTTIMPAFYDVLLQGKVARDEESSEMLDMLFADTFIDLGNIYNFANIGGKIDDLNGTHNTAVVSALQSVMKSAEAEIEKLVAEYTEE